MGKKKVLFVCVHNSARSQMAEVFLNTLAGDRFEAESAGLAPGTLNPLAVAVMKEIGIDISQNRAKSVSEFHRQGRIYEYVITVCSEADSVRCPVFPGKGVRLHWTFADPAVSEGSREQRLEMARAVRDQIKEKIMRFIS